MQTLDLECPSCAERLELDAGFAGGVCRCSNCGTLMTVPRDAGRAEQLSRPERVDPNDDMPIDPTDLQPVSQSLSRTRGGKKKRGKGGRSKRKPSAADSTTIDAGEYRTASGRVVNVDAPTRVPMAQGKRRQVRIATTVVFLSVVLGVVAVAIVALVMIIRGGDAPGGGDAGGDSTADGSQTTPPPMYDAQANPYLVDFPSVAGLPISGKVALVVESSRSSKLWMGQAAHMIQAGLRKRGEPTQVALFAAVKGDPLAFAEGKPSPLPSLNQTQLATWFNELPLADDADRSAAIERALQIKPDILVLLISGASRDEVVKWDTLVGDDADLVVHAVLINGFSPKLRSWMRDREVGEFVSLAAQDMTDWKNAIPPAAK